MSQQSTRLETLLNHNGAPLLIEPGTAAASDSGVTITVDGKPVPQDESGATTFDLANGEVTPGLPDDGSGSGDVFRAHADGLGDNPAQVDIDVPAGQQPPPYDVKQNPDGSLDITIPKGPGHPHDITIHVPPGEHLRIELGKGADGHLEARIDRGKPGDQPGTEPPNAGTPPPGAEPLPQPPPPEQPKMPSGGGGPPPGGGGGPSGGGPSGGGGPPFNPPPIPQQPRQNPSADGGTRTADQQAMRDLGDNVDRNPGTKMDQAKQRLSGVDVGWPSFGVLGQPLNQAHSTVQQAGVQYLTQGRQQLKQWRDALHGTADNWNGAESASTLPGG